MPKNYRLWETLPVFPHTLHLPHPTTVIRSFFWNIILWKRDYDLTKKNLLLKGKPTTSPQKALPGWKPPLEHSWLSLEYSVQEQGPSIPLALASINFQIASARIIFLVCGPLGDNPSSQHSIHPDTFFLIPQRKSKKNKACHYFQQKKVGNWENNKENNCLKSIRIFKTNVIF